MQADKVKTNSDQGQEKADRCPRPACLHSCTQKHRLAAGSPRWSCVSTQGRFWSVTKYAWLLVIDFFACQVHDNFLAWEGDRGLSDSNTNVLQPQKGYKIGKRPPAARSFSSPGPQGVQRQTRPPSYLVKGISGKTLWSCRQWGFLGSQGEGYAQGHAMNTSTPFPQHVLICVIQCL